MTAAGKTNVAVRRPLVAACLLLALTAACDVGGYGSATPPDGSAGSSAGGSVGAGGSSPGGSGGAGAVDGGMPVGGTAGTLPDPTAQPNFQLRPEFAGPCARAPSAIDVNLGNRAEDFVRAAFCQVNGTEPPAAVVSQWADQLRTVEYVRRIDVVRTFCRDAGRACAMSYSNPWLADIPLEPVCARKTTRDLGAVLMFFSDCPRGVNCGMDWANTHAHGMNTAHPLFGFGSAPVNYYNPRNAGYWYRQLLDARWAGLQFFLVNTYGPELAGAPDQLAMLGQALAKAGPGVKVALFDDPWSWGQPSSPPAFKTRPNLSDTEAAAQTLYQAKWKPFYSRVDKQFWYLYKNRPFIYFYNAGTLLPLNASAAVFARMKQLFTQDFGVTPFLVVEKAYFQDPGMPGVADSEFTWNTVSNSNGMKSRSTLNGDIVDHYMVKWDPIGRDKAGTIATAGDRIIKGTKLLADRLASSQDAAVAVIATWNDLGEGTGIERNYDYYLADAWSPPTTFMSVTRAAQCGD
ncbi:MAG TPA: DUF5010 domain-containing protein [Polyangia bacterium]|jgi:hypothetical protein|nr:DUF5010 domain-containing protein [Polyangia bacterium]